MELRISNNTVVVGSTVQFVITIVNGTTFGSDTYPQALRWNLSLGDGRSTIWLPFFCYGGPPVVQLTDISWGGEPPGTYAYPALGWFNASVTVAFAANLTHPGDYPYDNLTSAPLPIHVIPVTPPDRTLLVDTILGIATAIGVGSGLVSWDRLRQRLHPRWLSGSQLR
ncbi:MAG: hypothetical protein L3K11_03515 [Thermoplasmata archaeon]|nr:hypothetical protein [Thermoplasmata archaeon]